MKKVLSLVLALVMVFSLALSAMAASYSIKVSTTNLSVEKGEKTTFNIVATNAQGKVKITSNDTSIATVSSASVWVESDTQSITVKGVKAGTTTITVECADCSDAPGDNEITDVYTINVTVKEKATTTTTTKAATTTTKAAKTTTTKAAKTTTEFVVTTAAPTVVDLATLNVFAGNDVTPTLESGKYEYDVKVPNGTTALKVDATAVAEDATVEVIGADSISDGSTVNVKVTAKDGSVTVYTLNIKEEAATVVKQSSDSGISVILVIALILAGLIVGLVIGFIIGMLIGKKRYDNKEQFVYEVDDSNTPNIPYTPAGDDGFDDGVASPFSSGFNFASSGYDFEEPADDGFEMSVEESADNVAPVIPSYMDAQATVEPEINVAPVAPVFAAPVAPVVEPVAAEPVAPVFEAPVAPAPVVEPVAPVAAEPVAPVFEAPVAPAPVVEPVAPVAAEPVAPVFEAPVAPAPVVEPVAPVAPVAAEPVIPQEFAAAPVAEPVVAEPVAPVAPVAAEPVAPVFEAPVAPTIEPTSFAAAPVAPVAPVAEPAEAVLPTFEPTVAEPVIPQEFAAAPVAPVTPEPVQPFVDDAPPVLPYQAGTTLGDNPFDGR